MRCTPSTCRVPSLACPSLSFASKYTETKILNALWPSLRIPSTYYVLRLALFGLHM